MVLGLGQAIEELVGDFASAADPETLWSALRDHVRSKGLRAVLYNPGPASMAISTRARLPEALFSDGFAAEWLDGLRGGGLGPDAAMLQSARASLPVLWSSLTGEHGGEEPEAGGWARALLRHGGGDGVMFPLYGRGLRTGYLLAGFGGPAGEHSPSAMRALHCGAQIAHLFYTELSERTRRSGPLSPRELEVLAWIARGKSNAAIATTLEVSYHTVDTMVRRIFSKLEAGDRTTATVKGLAAGLIDLPDLLR